MATVKRVKRKLNIKALLVLLLIIYLIGMFLYTIITRPIKNIYIKNTRLITDNEIIEVAGIKDYPSIFSVSTKKMEEAIGSLELVNKVDVKKKLNGKIVIEIEEAYPVFYNRVTGLVMLSNGKEVENKQRYMGIPTLVKRVPNELLQEFVKSLNLVDKDIIGMINEILYDPDIEDDIIIDDSRFKLFMSDGNIVYVNIVNMKRLNDYKTFYQVIGDAKGTLSLDSYDSSNNLLGLFTAFKDNNVDNSNDGGNSNGGED